MVLKPMPKQDKEGGINPAFDLVSSLPPVCCPQGEFVETTLSDCGIRRQRHVATSGKPAFDFKLEYSYDTKTGA